jgi:enamine deaminase RidA (YjgF/YER057c/UK114 family)
MTDQPRPEHLPEPPTAQGRYRTVVRYGAMVVSAGMTPRVDGVLVHVGKVGRELSLDEARAAAAVAAANAVAAVIESAGSADAIACCLRLAVYVNATDDFTAHSVVADAASERVESLLGERGRAARAAIGVASLPGGAPVEIELWCALTGSR